MVSRPQCEELGKNSPLKQRANAAAKLEISIVYFRLSTSGLTTGPPSSYTQPQSGLKPRHQAEQGSASPNTVSASEGVVSEAQNCGCPLTKQVIELPYTGTVRST